MPNSYFVSNLKQVFSLTLLPRFFGVLLLHQLLCTKLCHKIRGTSLENQSHAALNALTARVAFSFRSLRRPLTGFPLVRLVRSRRFGLCLIRAFVVEPSHRLKLCCRVLLCAAVCCCMRCVCWCVLVCAGVCWRCVVDAFQQRAARMPQAHPLHSSNKRQNAETPTNIERQKYARLVSVPG